MTERSKTYALLVGIEQYDAASNWSLNGPASDVRRMVKWLLKNEVPKEHITVLLSTMEQNVQVKQEIEMLLGRASCTTRSEDVIREVKALQQVTADLFLFYWGGHGWSTPRGERCLYCTDATLRAFEHLNLASLLETMQTDWYKGLVKQVFLVDACANYMPNAGSRPPRYDFGGGKTLTTLEQFALFAAKPGEASKNLDALQTGLFTHELLQQLQALTADESWPPDFPALARGLRQRFQQLKDTDPKGQTPSHFWFRDSATGDEGFFGTTPLAELQELLTQALGSDEEKRTLARVWYVRSLRHMPAATDQDRDAGERSIAGMLSVLDEWQQQPKGDLPLLTFAEGLAEQAGLPQEKYDMVKKLSALRAKERGLDAASIEMARKRLKDELEKTPEALQIFLLPEQKALSVDDPQMTFEVTLYTWEGASETGQGGSCIPCGQVERQTLAQAQEYIGRRLATDLADPSPSIIEFFVPYQFMCCDVDQWPYKKDAEMSFSPQLGTEFPVVLRSYDRLLKRKLRASSRARWPFKPAALPSDVIVRWLQDLRQSEQQIYNVLRQGDPAPCLVLGMPVAPDSFPVWRASVWAGVSIGLWLRSGVQSPLDVGKQLYRLLTGKPLETAGEAETCPSTLTQEMLRALPQRVFSARQAGYGPELNNLTLFWDDPNRLPPENRAVSP